MEATSIMRLMTVIEARECVNKINSTLNDTRALILDLYEREGWSALGYKSWNECVSKEFNRDKSTMYKELKAAQTERTLKVAHAPHIPTRQLLSISRVDSPDQQKEAWTKAVETAPEGKVTARHVEKVVTEIVKHPKDPNIDAPEIISEKFMSAFENFLSAVKNEKALKWKTTSKKDALKYVEILKDVILI